MWKLFLFLVIAFIFFFLFVNWAQRKRERLAFRYALAYILGFTAEDKYITPCDKMKVHRVTGILLDCDIAYANDILSGKYTYNAVSGGTSILAVEFNWFKISKVVEQKPGEYYNGDHRRTIYIPLNRL